MDDNIPRMNNSAPNSAPSSVPNSVPKSAPGGAPNGFAVPNAPLPNYQPPQPIVIPTNEADFYANKLLLATVIGIVAFFTSIFGLIPSIIGLAMTKEIPMNYSPKDTARAQRLNLAALIISLIEILGGLITLIVIILIDVL